MALRSVPIRRIGTRATLFMGGDRELVLLTAILCAVLVFVVQNWAAFFWGVATWIFAVWVCRIIAKADPLMRHVYLRHLKYQKYYAPRATPFHANTTAFAKRFL